MRNLHKKAFSLSIVTLTFAFLTGAINYFFLDETFSELIRYIAGVGLLLFVFGGLIAIAIGVKEHIYKK